MWHKGPLTKLALIGLFAVLFLYNGLAMAVGPADSIRNVVESNGIVALEMQVQPAVNQPGDTVTLIISAVNRGNQAAPISVDAAIPGNLTYDVARIPSSTSINLQTNSFSWQPVVPAGQSRTFELPLTVGSADMSEPIRRLEAQIENGGLSQTLSAEFWVGVLPEVEIIGPDSVSVGQSIQLYADILGPGPFEQRWDSGDGRSLRADDPSLSFASAGEQVVSLAVQNPLGGVVISKTIDVVPDPVAIYTLDDLTPSTDQPIRFVNQSGGVGPLSYRWDFGDGSVSAEREPTHAYPETGTYIVTLVTENEFGSAESKRAVTVGQAPAGNMELPTTAKVGQILSGKGFGDATVTEFQWLMGDGRMVTGSDLSYIYTSPGTYTVALLVRNEFGVTQLEQTIQVEEGILSVYLPMIYSLFQWQSPNQLALEPTLEFSEGDFVPIDLERDVAPFDSTPEQRLLWYINKARETNGVPPLAYKENLSIASKRHTNDMAFNRFTAHTGSDGSRPSERQIAAGYTGGYAGEATAWGFEFPSGAVAFWLQSPSHRPLILNRRADEIGVAFTYDETAPSVYYWTVELGNSSGEYSLPFGGAAPAPTLTPTPQPAPTIEPTQPIVIVVVPADTAVPEEPVVVVVEEPTATATPEFTPTPQPVVITVTATTVVTKPVIVIPTQVPTQTPVATLTPTQTPTPTAPPTIAPTPTDPPAIVTSTPVPTQTPIPTETPLPTVTPTPSATPTTSAEAIVTSTPIPVDTEEPESTEPEPPVDPDPVDTEGSTDSNRSVQTSDVALAFVAALLDDDSGVTALPYATYAMQAELLANPPLVVLGLDALPAETLFVAEQINSDAATAETVVNFRNADGTITTRRFALQFAQNQWRVDSIR